MLRFLSTLLLAFALAVPASAHMRFVAFSAEQETDSTSAGFTAITGLTIPYWGTTAGVGLEASCYFITTSSNAGTAVTYSMSGSGSPAVTAEWELWDTTTTKVFHRYASTGYTNTATTGNDGADSILTTRHINRLVLWVEPGAVDTTITFSFTPDANTSATIEAGSWCEYSYVSATP